MTSLFAPSTRTLELYPWQKEAVQGLRANIRNGVRNQILAAPTGAGKTVIATHLIDECYRKGKRAIFVCDRKPLIKQTSDMFDEYGIPHGIIQADHWRSDSYHKVQVASAQTLASRGWPSDVPDLIVVDEAHAVYESVEQRIIQRDTVTIGLTATPFGKLGGLYDAVVNVRTMNQLRAEGYLCPFDAFAPVEPDMEDAKVSAGEWTKDEAERRSLPIIGDAVSEYLEKAHPRKFIAFGVTIKHCEELQKQFLAAGVQCSLYTKDTDDAEREAIDRDFKKREGHITGLISVAALSKGFDAPTVECIIMCRPLRSSFAEHIQVLGRGLRRDPDNPEKRCIVLDLAGNMMRFYRRMQDFFEYGVHELDDGKRREKKTVEPKEPEPMKCPRCATVHRRSPLCPHCGHTYPSRCMIEHLPGKLVALGSVMPENEGDLKADVFAQLRWYAEQKKYMIGWAAYQFEDLFGNFDPALWRVPAKPATEKTLDWILSQQIRNAKRRKK